MTRSPLTFDRVPPTVEWRGRPILRLMWLSGARRIEWGRGDYYDWRWWLGIGPLLILAGRAS